MSFPCEQIDIQVAERILSRFASYTPAQKTILEALFALFRKGHLVLNTSEEGILSACDVLEIQDRASFVCLIKEGMSSSFIDRDHVVWVIQKGDLLYLQKNAQLENTLLNHLFRLHNSIPALPLNVPQLPSHLSEEQAHAITQVFSSPLSFITGGPGTGKTFTATMLIKAFQEAADEFSLIITAPTGKAAFHLSSKISCAHLTTGTLHALLGKKKFQNRPLKFLCADLIIIDESSMIDASLFTEILSQIPSGCRVVFLGDKNQLPPVETGSIFADLVDFSPFPVTTLTTSIRTQASPLLALAQAVLSSQDIVPLLKEQKSWIDLETIDEITFFNNLFTEYKEKFSHILPFDHYTDEELFSKGCNSCPLLCCMRQGPLGTDTLNAYFYEKITVSASNGSLILVPLLVTANHYDLELYNGDQGVLVIHKQEGCPLLVNAHVVFATRKIPLGALSSYAFHYALSVHKSQGSEYEEVMIIAPSGSEIFGREVLYTAITRAKHRVRIASTQTLLYKTVQKTSRKGSGLNFKLDY